MKTWATLKEEIKREMNAEGENFYEDDELLGWCNDAVNEVAGEIVGLYDKYLETTATLTMTSGSDEVSLPADIYANKITGLYYIGNGKKYEIKPLVRKADILIVEAGDEYRYRILNGVSGRVIKLFPESRESSSNLVCYYVRNPGSIVDDEDVIDIPVADNFIKQYIKDRMYNKEVGAEQWPTTAVRNEKLLLLEALGNMIPDENTEIEMDLSFYDDFDSDFYGY